MAEPQAHASGNWHVAVGNESEFLARWQEFLEWTKASIPGFITASLLRDSEDPRNFVSVAKWESPDARTKWKAHEGFAEHLMACRKLCDGFEGGDFDLAVLVS